MKKWTISYFNELLLAVSVGFFNVVYRCGRRVKLSSKCLSAELLRSWVKGTNFFLSFFFFVISMSKTMRFLSFLSCQLSLIMASMAKWEFELKSAYHHLPHSQRIRVRPWSCDPGWLLSWGQLIAKPSAAFVCASLNVDFLSAEFDRYILIQHNVLVSMGLRGGRGN